MNIAVIFGGKSCEHNISIATGVQAANALLSTGNKIICSCIYHIICHTCHIL